MLELGLDLTQDWPQDKNGKGWTNGKIRWKTSGWKRQKVEISNFIRLLMNQVRLKYNEYVLVFGLNVLVIFYRPVWADSVIV